MAYISAKENHKSYKRSSLNGMWVHNAHSSLQKPAVVIIQACRFGTRAAQHYLCAVYDLDLQL